MRFLADESCDDAFVHALRTAGYEVATIAERMPSIRDEAVLDLAVREERVLLTEDRDFGELIFLHGLPAGTVIYLRYPKSARRAMVRQLLGLIEEHGEGLLGCFVVMRPGQVCIVKGAGG